MTEPKDYYALLELPPSADAGAVKKAYRRLAQVFHPDKTNNDPYANAKFRSIKEAYEVLSDPRKKEQYLQQRWYQQSTGRKMSSGEAVTPPLLLQDALELYRYVRTLDVHRMDHEGLTQKILHLLQEDQLQAVLTFNEPETLQEVYQVLIRCAAVLPADQIRRIRPFFGKLTGDDPAVLAQTDRLIHQHQRRETRERWTPWLILLLSVAAIISIFLLAR